MPARLTVLLTLLGSALVSALVCGTAQAAEADGASAVESGAERAVGAASAAASRPAAGAAQQRRGPPTGWTTELGAAVIVNPEFQGAESYQVLPVPYFDFRYRDEKGVKYFANVPQGFGGYFLRQTSADGRRLAASAALAPGFANRDPDDFDGLDTFGPGIEARARLEYGTRRWGLDAQVAQALGSGHEGLYLDLGASWRTRVGQTGFLSVGPSLRFGDDTYMSALYGITAREEARTGLRAFDAGAGFESLALQGVLSVPITGKWRFTGVARFGQLIGDAEDSSLTEEPVQAFMLFAATRRL